MERKWVIFLMLTFSTQANYLINGDFSIPQIDINSFVFSTSANPEEILDGWMGVYEVFGSNSTYNLFDTQSVDLEGDGNGYITQTVTVPEKGVYVLSFQKFSWNQQPNSAVALILWNNQLIGVSQAIDKNIVKESFTFQINEYVDQLKFVQIGTVDFDGIRLNNIQLNLLSYEESSQPNIDDEFPPTAQKIVSGFRILPMRNLKGLKYIPIFIEELSMYFYDRRFYNGTMKKILQITSKLENLKRSLAQSFAKIPINSSIIPASSLVAYSNQKHMEIDETDDNFVRGVFPFTILTITPTLLITLTLFFIFKCTSKYQFSIFFRRYYFLFPCLLQGLIEGNIQYFTYLFFKQSFVCFSFKFMDKAFIIIALIFFFAIFMTTCCYYYLFNNTLGKKFGYFIYDFYRTFPSMTYLSFRMIMRGFVKGAIHSCLHQKYGVQILLLCIMELLTITLTIILEKYKKIFMKKLIFSLSLCYNFLFLIFNIVIYVEESLKDNGNSEETQKIFIQLEEYIIYLMIAVTIGQVITDFIPYSSPNKDQGQKNQNSQHQNQIEILDITKINEKNAKKLKGQKSNKKPLAKKKLQTNNSVGKNMSQSKEKYNEGKNNENQTEARQSYGGIRGPEGQKHNKGIKVRFKLVTIEQQIQCDDIDKQIEQKQHQRINRKHQGGKKLDESHIQWGRRMQKMYKNFIDSL